MSTKAPFIDGSIPMPTDDPNSVAQAVMAIKQNIEAHHDFPRSRPNMAPSAATSDVNTALRAVTKTLPF